VPAVSLPTLKKGGWPRFLILLAQPAREGAPFFGGWPILRRLLFFLAITGQRVPHPFGYAQGRLLRCLHGWE
jgi:hypothetical protein